MRPVVSDRKRFTPEMIEAIKQELGPDGFAHWFVGEMQIIEREMRAKDPTCRGILLSDTDERPHKPLYWFFSPVPPAYVKSPPLAAAGPGPEAQSAPASGPPDLRLVQGGLNVTPGPGGLPLVDHSFSDCTPDSPSEPKVF